MKRLLLVALSLLGLGLATVASQSNQTPNARGTAAAPVPHHFGGIQPRISPDGRQIAFSYQGAICRIARTGGTIVRLTDGSGFDLEPAWSPDGTQIAFVNEPRWAGGDLRIIRTDDGSTVPLAKPVAVVDTVFYSKVEFHPDGRLLANVRIDGNNIGLALLNPATGAVQPIVNPSRQARFALSRDGQWLAYTATMDVDGQQTGNDGPQADIWKISTAGGQPVRIVRFESRVHDLCWGADGRSLYVVSELGGAHDDIWHVPIDDPDRARRITSGQADETRPSVSADGRWLACSDNRDGATALVVRDLANGTDMTLPISGLDFRAPAGTLRLTIRDKQSGRPVTARIALQHEGGKFHAPPGALHRVLDDYSHFYCDGAAQWSLPAGKYHLRAFRGPEYRATHLDFTVSDGRTQEITVDLDRWTSAAERGWYSGENHIHANYGYGQWYNTPQSMLEQCAGEDLRVCNFMVANSDTNGVFDREFFRGHADPLSTADTTLYWNQEFRSTLWGHMTLVNLSQVVEPVFTGFKDTTNPWDIPTNSDIADRAHLQSGLVNYTHGAQNPSDPYVGPYAGKGIPIDVALGKIDTIDLNASYAGTVPLWHRLLNCGFRVAPSAGTDCFLNRIRSRLPGADRVYVKIDGPFSYSAWIDGLRAGRTFVSSGPMLELVVDDRRSGDTLRLSAPREVHIVARATSQFPLNRVEVIFNGQVVANGSVSGVGRDVAIDTRLNIPRSGWISLRAAGATHRDHSGGPLEAHAAPIYIEVAGKPAASRSDAEYFLQWIDRISLSLRLRDRIPSAELKRHVENQLEAARAVYTKIAQRGE